MPGYFRLAMHCRKRCMHRAVRRELASGCARYPIQSNGNLGAEGSRDGITGNARFLFSTRDSFVGRSRTSLETSLLFAGERPKSPPFTWHQVERREGRPTVRRHGCEVSNDLIRSAREVASLRSGGTLFSDRGTHVRSSTEITLALFRFPPEEPAFVATRSTNFDPSPAV